jgi:hypothetical protein
MRTFLPIIVLVIFVSHLHAQQQIQVIPPSGTTRTLRIISSIGGTVTPTEKFDPKLPVLLVFDPVFGTMGTLPSNPTGTYSITNVEIFQWVNAIRQNVTATRVTSALNVSGSHLDTPYELDIEFVANGLTFTRRVYIGTNHSPTNFSIRSSFFNIKIGSNFDFIDKLKVKNIYGNVEAFIPTFNGKESSRFGARLSLSQMRSITTQDTSVFFRRTRDPLFLQNAGDSATVAIRDSRFTSQTTSDRLILNAQLTYSLYKSPLGGTASTNLYILLGAEAVSLTRRIAQELLNSNQDTIKLPISEVNALPALPNRISLAQTLGSFSVVGGLGGYHLFNDVLVHYSSSYGYSGETKKIGLLTVDSYVQFNAVGIVIGTHIRGYDGFNSRPETFIYFSKVITPKQLVALFKAD